MDDLLNYDEKHLHLIKFNELLPNGKSFYTSINPSNNNVETLVQYYLNHGVDPNSPDIFDVYPLEYAINCHSVTFINILLNSNRIGTSIRLKKYHNQTYLHLAVMNPSTFSPIFNRNLIDINVKDDLGETTLMKACNTFDVNVRMDLFNDDNLDYKHPDNNGEDVLDIVKKNFLDGIN